MAGTTPTPPNRKINKTARATVDTVPYLTVGEGLSFIEEKKREQAYILAIEITDASQSLLSFTLPDEARGGDRELIIVPGSENYGVPTSVLSSCATAVHLPMYGRNTSMNVAVALGAAMYLLLPQLKNAR